MCVISPCELAKHSQFFPLLVGYWEGDLKHGFGTYTYCNGDTYEGDWNNNVRHGQGTYTYVSSGAKYIGGWVNGRREGVGEIILSNYSYKGKFTADQVNKTEQ